jgi:hypothetical protein
MCESKGSVTRIPAWRARIASFLLVLERADGDSRCRQARLHRLHHLCRRRPCSVRSSNTQLTPSCDTALRMTERSA